MNEKKNRTKPRWAEQKKIGWEIYVKSETFNCGLVWTAFGLRLGRSWVLTVLGMRWEWVGNALGLR